MGRLHTCVTTFVNTDILTYLCDLCDVSRPLLGARVRYRRRHPALPRTVIVSGPGVDTLMSPGELTGQGAALWRTGAR